MNKHFYNAVVVAAFVTLAIVLDTWPLCLLSIIFIDV